MRITTISGHKCRVAKTGHLNPSWPKFEIHAPPRHNFNGPHSLLAVSAKDAERMALEEGVVACAPDCECQEEPAEMQP